jgi:hypothetical protein
VEINAATPDASGNLYVAGDVSGSLPGQTSAGNRDAFVRKYDANGSVVLTWQFGGTSNDTALGIAVDAAGAVYVTGYTMGTLPGLTSAGGWDTYVRKFNANGTVAWTRQLGSVTNDVSYAVAVDGAGGVYITGYAGDPLPGQMAYGSQDIFVHKYDASGNVAWTRQYGPTMHSSGRAIAIDANNNIYVTGYSYGALPGQASSGNADPFIRKYDQSGNTIWTTQFAYGYGEGIGIDATGNLYLVGYGGLAGQQSAGGWDIFVRKFSGDASVLWTRQFGTSASDAVPTIGVNASGDVAVTGRVSTAYHGQTHAGLEDVYVRKFNASGTELWNTQFGTAADEIPFAAAIDPAGNVYSAGWTGGALPGQTLTGSQDAFVVQVIPP